MNSWLISGTGVVNVLSLQVEEGVAEEKVLSEERLPYHLSWHGEKTPNWSQRMTSPAPSSYLHVPIGGSYMFFPPGGGGATQPHRSYCSLPVVPFFYFEVFTRRVRWPIRRERAAADETEEKEEEKDEEAELKEKDVREKGACGRKGAHG